MKVLAIETSCDETAAAVVEGNGVKNKAIVLSNVVASSLPLHAQTGGIVPEVAAREQLTSIIPVIKEALEISNTDLSDIDGIAVTQGPGLIGSLLVGVETAKILSKSSNIPLFPVNHMLAHLYSNWIDTKSPPLFPALGMIVSGGHTDIVLFEKVNKYSWLGGTRDDAAGECFDKCARVILNAPYPGGPVISKAAKEVGDRKIEKIFPRPMIFHKNLEMSFSGLKTAVLNRVRKENNLSEKMKSELSYDLEKAIVEVLISKLSLALEDNAVASVLVGGGVVANDLLRSQLEKVSDKYSVPVYVPENKYCSDNAAMIGAAAVVAKTKSVEIDSFFADPNLQY